MDVEHALPPQPEADPAALKVEQSIDDALDGSFPASDSPPWTLGSTRDALRLPEHSHTAAAPHVPHPESL
jgi:hypothetical protein